MPAEEFPAHREDSYNGYDLRFTKTSLQALMPEEDFASVLKGLEDYEARR